MPAQGTLAITARGDGHRWYGRISISDETARKANLREGTRISARSVEGGILIEADEHGRIKFPPARGKSDKRHAFEAATTTLGLKEIRLPQSATHATVTEGRIKITVPKECIAEDEHRKRRPRKKPPKPIAEPRQEIQPNPTGNKMWGTAAAIVTEANRSGKRVQPMSLSDIIELIKEKGGDVHVMGPRFFRLNGKSVTVPDLLDEANRLNGSTEQDRIALIME